VTSLVLRGGKRFQRRERQRCDGLIGEENKISFVNIKTTTEREEQAETKID